MSQISMMFPAETPNIHLCDVWPPLTLTEDKMRAYKHFEDVGMIRIKLVQVSKSTGAHTVHYLSTVPKEFILQELKDFVSKGADTL